MSQQVREGRVEIEISSFSDSYYLLPVGQNGLLLFGQANKFERGHIFYEFSMYNTNFQKEWSAEVEVDRSMQYQKHFYDANSEKLFVFMATSKGFLLVNNYTVICVDVKTSEVSKIVGRFDTYVFVKDFLAVNNVVYLGGHYFPARSELFLRQAGTMLGLYIPAIFGSMRFKLNPLLIAVDFNTREQRSLLDKTSGNTKVVSLSVDFSKHILSAFISNKEKKNVARFDVLQYTDNSLTPSSFTIQIGEYDLTSGKALSVNEEEQIVIGTYAMRPKSYKEKSLNHERSLSTVSMGLYYCKIKNGVQEFIKVYPFYTFRNFYNYLNNRARGRIDRRISRAESRDREPGFEYNILVHDLIKKENEYLMIAEAYYPEYEQRCYYQYNPTTGFSDRICYDVFTGYRFTHAILASFDTNGNVIWDNSFEISEVLTYNLKPQVRYIVEGDEILLLYAYGDEIKSQLITGSEVIEGKSSLKIPAARPEDRVRETLAVGIEHWYDNVFVAYGYQRIRSESSEGRNRRRVFYFNKIEYR
ncbi:MAG: hypothetical protein PHT69_16685 [Bacteroidales bacterium]|nr:hypothetical protein [Bacteroidales bacterium]